MTNSLYVIVDKLSNGRLPDIDWICLGDHEIINEEHIAIELLGQRREEGHECSLYVFTVKELERRRLDY